MELQLRESEAGSESDKYGSHGRVALGRLQVGLELGLDTAAFKTTGSRLTLRRTLQLTHAATVNSTAAPRSASLYVSITCDNSVDYVSGRSNRVFPEKD